MAFLGDCEQAARLCCSSFQGRVGWRSTGNVQLESAPVKFFNIKLLVMIATCLFFNLCLKGPASDWANEAVVDGVGGVPPGKTNLQSWNLILD